jgi:hypothetical protein
LPYAEPVIHVSETPARRSASVPVKDIPPDNYHDLELEPGPPGKKGFVYLSASVDCHPYAACNVAITGSGIDLVENEEALSRQFPLESG